jgi:hypothetical protein
MSLTMIAGQDYPWSGIGEPVAERGLSCEFSVISIELLTRPGRKLVIASGTGRGFIPLKQIENQVDRPWHSRCDGR